MKKLVLSLCVAAGLAGGFAAASARADVGPNDDADSGYQPRYRHREYAEERGYREEVYEHCRPARVYIVERGCPVRRVVYFDPYGRCFYPAGPRRVYVENYYYNYPHLSRHRPRFGVSFNFGG